MIHQKYLLDTDVLVTAAHSYYSFHICPGFWSSMIHFNERGSLFSIDLVQQEIKSDDIVQWIKDKVPNGFFIDISKHLNIIHLGKRIMDDVQNTTQYHSSAIDKFFNGADVWLIAAAKTLNYKLITNEVSAPNSKKRYKNFRYL